MGKSGYSVIRWKEVVFPQNTEDRPYGLVSTVLSVINVTVGCRLLGTIPRRGAINRHQKHLAFCLQLGVIEKMHSSKRVCHWIGEIF